MTDFPKTTRDKAPTDDIVTGTGDAMPSKTASKRLYNVRNGDVSKGHGRYDKYVVQKGSDQGKEASKGATTDKVRDGVVGGRP